VTLAIGYAALGVLLQSVLAWRLSTRHRCASIADIFWPLHHLLAATVLLIMLPAKDTSTPLIVMGLLLVWATRLASHLTIRQAGAPEDRRYHAIRLRIGDDFDRKSLFLIFIPQSLMAWFMTLLLIPALNTSEWSLFAYAGLGLAAVGLIWEVAADIQLAAFLKGPTCSRVLDAGLWSICRHPNYFGEWLFWLGLAITAFALTDDFAFFAALPMLLLTFLLLRFTGVVRTENDIASRRPEYEAYQQAVPAFFPNPFDLWRSIADRVAEWPGRSGRQMGWWALLLTLAASMMEPAYANTDTDTRQTWFFDVKIDGKDVGYHKFTTNRDEDGFDVRAEAEFRYKILGVTVFSYEHEVTEQYDPNMCLQSIASETKTNGDIQRLQGSSNASSFVLVTDTESVVEESCLITFAYWSPSLLSRQQLLNGQTGDLVEISVAPLTPPDESLSRNAYALTGEMIDITLGYDTQGNWQTLESTLGHGRILSYHLRP
jgi:steroid 5-alpha reductase family enzyme